MIINGQVIEAQYKTGVSPRTGNEYELTEYVVQSTDEQKHNHRIAFLLFGDKMRQEAVHKGDWVELSYTLGIREYNGKMYNDISDVYFVRKLNEDETATNEALMTKQEAKQQAQHLAAPAQEGNGLPF